MELQESLDQSKAECEKALNLKKELETSEAALKKELSSAKFNHKSVQM